MQRETAHGDEDGWIERLDELELSGGGDRVAGADPGHADAGLMGAAGPNLPGGVDAERKGYVAQVARSDPRAGKGAGPRYQAVAHVLEGARVEHRPARGAARAPVLGDLVLGRDAQLRHELAVRHLA